MIKAPSGNFYIGSAASFCGRQNCHRSKLSKGNHFSKQLQDAANKYGIDKLEFKPIFKCSRADLLLYEQAFLDSLKPAYNSAKFAGSPMAGRKHGEEFRKNIAKTRAENPERLMEAAAKAAATRAAQWARMTPEELAADSAYRKEAIRAGNEKYKTSMTKEQKEAHREKLKKAAAVGSAAAKARLDAMTPEEREEAKSAANIKRANAQAKKSPEELAEIGRKKGAGGKYVRTAEARAAMSETVRAAKARRKLSQ